MLQAALASQQPQGRHVFGLYLFTGSKPLSGACVWQLQPAMYSNHIVEYCCNPSRSNPQGSGYKPAFAHASSLPEGTAHLCMLQQMRNIFRQQIKAAGLPACRQSIHNSAQHTAAAGYAAPGRQPANLAVC